MRLSIEEYYADLNNVTIVVRNYSSSIQINIIVPV